MSDTPGPGAPINAASVAAIPLNVLRPPEGFWGHACHAVRVGWRPASGWACVLILFVNGAVLPAARLWGLRMEPLDWKQLTPFAALLVGQAGLRSLEKITGAAL